MTTATIGIAASCPVITDACGAFFATALKAFDPPIPSDARVLEIGCAEYDFLSQAAAAWPAMTFVGIDWRACKPNPAQPTVTRIQGDVMVHDFQHGSFDWVVSISAIEHVGLSHPVYGNDPKAVDGDTVTMARAYQWLRPGGWCYLDVPYNPRRYEVVGTSHRIYDDRALRTRLIGSAPWIERWRGVVGKRETTRLLTDTPPLAGGEQFYYCGVWLHKPGGPDGAT